MQSDEGEARIDTDAAAAPPAASRFRLSPRTMALAAAGLFLLVAFAVGGWAFLARGERRQAERAHAEAQARVQAENEAVANSPENLSQLEAARKAHEEIMAADAPAVATLPAATGAPEAGAGKTPVAAAVAASTAPAAPAVAAGSTAPSDGGRAPAPASPPAVAAAPPKAPSSTPAPAVAPIREGPTPSVANDPPLSAAGGCTLSGGAPGFGTALGRCLEEYNRIERETRKAAPRQR